MKKILYSLFTLALLVFVGCEQDTILQPEQPTQAGDEVAVRFSADIPKYKTVTTRANGGVNDLILLVFDENGKFIYSRTANLLTQNETSGTFSVMMLPTTKQRTIHFISNYVFPDEFYDQSVGKTEQEVVTALESSGLLFWSRDVLASGINASTVFNSGQPVKLLRNQAKISVVSTETKFELQGFALYKAPDKGTAAPFNTATQLFTIGSVTQAAGAALSGVPDGLSFTMDEKMVFERLHQSASDYTAVIVKGLYEGEECYYKIDLLDKSGTSPVRYNIERNYHYKVTVNTVNMKGVTSIASAANGAAANNVVLDASLDKFPMITDGKEKMEIEKTVVLFTEPGKPLSVQVNYWPDITVNPDGKDNSGMTLVTSGNTSIFSVQPTVNSSGLITATITNTLPATLTEASIVVSKGSLSRKLRVLVITPFAFNPKINNNNPGAVGPEQNAIANLTFTIPNDFPDELFPLPINIYTQGLYAAATGLQLFVDPGGIIRYVYTATAKGEQTVPFKANQRLFEETITLKADYFTDATVNYTRMGNITFGSNTPISAGSTVSASVGSLAIVADGKYTYNSGGAADATSVTLTYNHKINDGYTERYVVTTTVGALKNHVAQNLSFTLHVFNGTLEFRYIYWRDIPANATVTRSPDISGSIFANPTNGRYTYEVPAGTNMSQSITFTYVRTSYPSGTYSVSRTLNSLTTDSRLRLTD